MAYLSWPMVTSLKRHLMNGATWQSIKAEGEFMNTRIRAAHNDPWMRRRIQTICEYAV